MSIADKTTSQNISRAIMRVLGSGIFLLAGISHLTETARTAARLENAPFGFLATSVASAELLVIFSGVALLGGGLLLLIGYKTRYAALLLAIVLIPITLTVQVSVQSLGPLFKNIAIMGILIFFATNGALAYSMDTILKRKRSRKDNERQARSTSNKNSFI